MIRKTFTYLSHIATPMLWAIVSLFIISRIVVVSIMSGVLPGWLFLNIGNVHIHHYVYGIFIIISTYLWQIIRNPIKKERFWNIFCFGVGLTLLFDEFGFWLTMGGSYYSKLSVDAIIFIFSLLLGISLLKKFKQVNTKLELCLYIGLFIGIALGIISITEDVYKFAQPYFNSLDSGSPK